MRTGLLGGLGLLAPAMLACGKPHEPPPADAPTASHATVAAYHQESAQAALDILQAGGNAFDAFVAATLVDDVVGYGVSTPAGQLGALIHVASSDTNIYLDGGYNDLAAGTKWAAGDPAGKTFVVPGEVAALEALSTMYGRLPFATAIQPAIQAATTGFTIDPDYAYAITMNAATLKASPYASSLFFPGGQPLAAGATLKQPELAALLTQVADQGAAYMYTGAWSQDCVTAVGSAGGALTAADLADYAAQWLTPWQTSYHGYDIVTSSGRTFGGLEELASLKTIEPVIGNVDAPLVTSTSGSVMYTTYTDEMLEVLVRTWRTVVDGGCGGMRWSDPALLDNAAAANMCLTSAYGATTWSNIDAALSVSARAIVAPHTFSVAIIDADGNAIAGTHTIEGGNWGAGIFVDGVVLNASAEIPFDTNTPDAGGQRRRITPLPMHLVMQGSNVTLALAMFGASEESAGFEFVVNALDLALPIASALSIPRFGATTTDANSNETNLLDWGFAADTVSTLQSRGIALTQATSANDPVDTGLAAAIEVGSDGTQTGATAPLRGAPCPSCDGPTVTGY